MFCNNCGKEMPADAGFCPYCGSSAAESQPKQAVYEEVNAPQTVPEPEKSKKFFNAPSKSGKKFTAMASAFTLIPAIFTLMVDYVWDLAVDWRPTGYIVGGLLVIWICLVLPAIKVTPAPVTAIICFGSAALYIMYIVKEISGSMEWFTIFALPMLMILAVFIGLDSALAQSEGIRRFMPGILSAEAAVYSFAWGLLWVNYHGEGVIQPRLSVISAGLLLILSVFLLAVGYVRKVDKN